MEELSGALDAWRRLLGDAHVVTDERTRAEVETATFATRPRVPAVIRPGDTREVQECVRIANHFRIQVYPVSRGKNWGFGSRVPAQDDCAVMELHRMDRIVDFSEELAYVTVEPGVSPAQLFNFLTERNSNLMISVGGTTPDSSFIGNAVERGFTASLYAERFAYVCGLEVVLPTGECVHTGFDRFAGAAAAPVHRWGVGPWIDGLFTQSNLGIVTRMTMWLARRPRDFQLALLSLDRDEQLDALVEPLRELRLEGVIRGSIGLWNDYKSVANTAQYPYDEAGGAVPLPASLLDRLKRRQKWINCAWYGQAPIYASSAAEGKALRAELERRLKGRVSGLTVFSRGTEIAARLLRHPYRLVTGIDPVTKLHEAFRQSSYLGVPTQRGLFNAYWRKRTPPPSDPHLDRDRCGLIWCCPVVPATARHVRAAVRVLHETSLAAGFEPHIAVLFESERAVNIVGALVYDREAPGEDERAMACYEQMLARLAADGYLPYRVGIQSMSALPAPRDDYRSVLDRLKSALDPNGILAPGRYHGS